MGCSHLGSALKQAFDSSLEVGYGTFLTLCLSLLLESSSFNQQGCVLLGIQAEDHLNLSEVTVLVFQWTYCFHLIQT